MRRALRLVIGAVACSLLAACQTDMSAFERPIAAQEGAKKNADKAADAPYPYTLADLVPHYRPSLQGDEAGLWMTVEKLEAQVKTAGNRVRDEELNAYVKDVVCRVAGKYCADIRVYVMEVPAFNATMYPNGMMQVWTGLLLRVQNEAQLAAVIGHEIAHYLRRHSLQRMRDIIEKSNAMIFFSMALAGAGIPAVGDIANLAVLGSISAFSRDHEREADGYGLLLMGRAGYNPQEAWRVWKRVIKEHDADKDKENPDLFTATHPASEERLKALHDLAVRVPVAGVGETGRDRFQKIVLPRRERFIKDELHLRHFDTLKALLDTLVEDGHDIAELHFYRGELFRLRHKKGDIDKAAKAYAKALKTGSPPAEIYRSIGLVRRAQGKRPEAAEAFRTYLERVPDAHDAGIVRQMLEETES